MIACFVWSFLCLVVCLGYLVQNIFSFRCIFGALVVWFRLPFAYSCTLTPQALPIIGMSLQLGVVILLNLQKNISVRGDAGGYLLFSVPVLFGNFASPPFVATPEAMSCFRFGGHKTTSSLDIFIVMLHLESPSSSHKHMEATLLVQTSVGYVPVYQSWYTIGVHLYVESDFLFSVLVDKHITRNIQRKICHYINS